MFSSIKIIVLHCQQFKLFVRKLMQKSILVNIVSIQLPFVLLNRLNGCLICVIETSFVKATGRWDKCFPVINRTWLVPGSGKMFFSLTIRSIWRAVILAPASASASVSRFQIKVLVQ
jgi:hypothetical protein